MHDDDDQKDQLMERVKKISSIALKLKVNNFKKNVLDECVELFYKNKFEEQLDTKINLIGFENGVYDLEKHEFRDGTQKIISQYQLVFAMKNTKKMMMI